MESNILSRLDELEAKAYKDRARICHLEDAPRAKTIQILTLALIAFTIVLQLTTLAVNSWRAY